MNSAPFDVRSAARRRAGTDLTGTPLRGNSGFDIGFRCVKDAE